MAVYGNVNVKYAPCKSVAQLHSAADYILGKKKEQLSSSVIKTKSELYNAFGCNRDNFANSVLMTRKMHQKKYSRFFPRDILAQKLSISFHPEDNDKLTYAEAYKMAEDFAREFFWKKGFEVLFAVHVDTEHVHVHFLVNNCNQKDGSSFRRGPKELVEMSEYFGEQCRSRGLTHSVRDSFYNPDKTREERTFAESQMEKRGKLSFKDEIRVFIRLAMNDPTTQNIHDVVNMLERTYQSMKDYPRWEEDEDEVKESASKAKKQIPTQESQPTRKPDVSVYEAYDEFQEKHEIPENDESFFYGAAFDDFNKEWQGLDAGAGSVSTEFGTTNNSTDAEPYNEDELDELLDNNSSTVPVQNKPFPSPAEYRKLSLEKRAKLLPPPSDDRIEELKKYQDRMGYTEESMRSMRYKMSVYDDFTEEYDYRVKYNRNHSSEEQLKAQAEQQIITPVRRRGRGR